MLSLALLRNLGSRIYRHVSQESYRQPETIMKLKFSAPQRVSENLIYLERPSTFCKVFDQTMAGLS
jgi:hypothetical protein